MTQPNDHGGLSKHVRYNDLEMVYWSPAQTQLVAVTKEESNVHLDIQFDFKSHRDLTTTTATTTIKSKLSITKKETKEIIK